MITRSGSNDFHGSAYGFTRNEKYIGSNVPQAYGDALDKPYATFKQDQLGARVGGPILKDTLFFFASGEANRLTQPTGTSADGSTSNSYKDPAGAAQFQSILTNQYGFYPGGLGDYNQRTNSDLLLGKLDFNASPSNNISLRYNYVNALTDTLGQTRSFSAYTFESAGYTFADKTNSGVLQVNSVFGSDSFNQGRVGYQTIRDSREVPTPFPSVYVCASPNQFCTGRRLLQPSSPGPNARPERTASIRTSSRSPTTTRSSRATTRSRSEPTTSSSSSRTSSSRTSTERTSSTATPTSPPGTRPDTRSFSTTGPIREGRPSGPPSSGASTRATSGGSTTSSR